MVRKENALHDLERVKLIIGNDFDLYCGLKTKYRDYFNFCRPKMKRIEEGWLKSMVNHLQVFINSGRRPKDYVSLVGDTERFNCWDVFFAIHHLGETTDDGVGERDYLWRDIEQMMLNSLEIKDASQASDYCPHWQNVVDAIQGQNLYQHGMGSFILATFLYKKVYKELDSTESIYEYILSELREFERGFAYFILCQHVFWTSVPTFEYNDGYIGNADNLIQELCNPENISSIDCFNYGFIPMGRYWRKLRFVNGNCLAPIFGVDSKFPPDDPRYIFTKTNRRIEMDMESLSCPESLPFDNAIVFGHSLSEHDHNYFFPILDQLEMTSFTSKKMIVFAYSVYEERERATIKKTIRKNIYSLFVAYAKYLGWELEEAPRLLDSLTTQGRVLMYEVDKPMEQAKDFLVDHGDGPWSIPAEDMARIWEAYIDYGKLG